MKEWKTKPCRTLAHCWSTTGASLLGTLAWLSGQEADPLAQEPRDPPIPLAPSSPGLSQQVSHSRQWLISE